MKILSEKIMKMTKAHNKMTKKNENWKNKNIYL